MLTPRALTSVRHEVEILEKELKEVQGLSSTRHTFLFLHNSAAKPSESLKHHLLVTGELLDSSIA